MWISSNAGCLLLIYDLSWDIFISYCVKVDFFFIIDEKRNASDAFTDDLLNRRQSNKCRLFGQLVVRSVGWPICRFVCHNCPKRMDNSTSRLLSERCFFCFFKERIIPGSEFKSVDKSGRSYNVDKPNKMENTTKPSPARNDLLITINQFLHSISKALWKSLKSLKGFHNFLAPSNFINYFESLLEL